MVKYNFILNTSFSFLDSQLLVFRTNVFCFDFSIFIVLIFITFFTVFQFHFNFKIPISNFYDFDNADFFWLGTQNEF